MQRPAARGAAFVQAVDAFGPAPVFGNHAKRSEAGAESAPRARLRFAEIINPHDKEDEVPIMSENAAITLEFDYHEVGKPKGCRTWRWRENVGSLEASIPVADEQEAPVAFRFDDPRSGEPVELRVFDGRIWRCMDVAFGGAGSVYRGSFGGVWADVEQGRREGFEPVPWSKDLPRVEFGPESMVFEASGYERRSDDVRRWAAAHMACCGMLWERVSEPRYCVDPYDGSVDVRLSLGDADLFGYSAAEREAVEREARKAFELKLDREVDEKDVFGRDALRARFERRLGEVLVEVVSPAAAADPFFSEIVEAQGLMQLGQDLGKARQSYRFAKLSAAATADGGVGEVVEDLDRLSERVSQLLDSRLMDMARRQSRTERKLDGEAAARAAEELRNRLAS